MLPVHNHSDRSALDGYSTPEEIAARVKALGMPGAFLTDHGTIAGLLPFRDAMHAQGLFAGYGAEMYMAPESRKIHEPRKKGMPKNDEYHLIVLAKNDEGYRNLLRLADESNRGESFYNKPRVDWDLLEKYREGLCVTSACMSSLVNHHVLLAIEQKDWGNHLEPLHRLRNIFRDDFYIELHTYDDPKQVQLNDMLAEVCEQFGITPLVANDAHYARPEDFKGQEAMSIISKQYQHPNCLYVMDEADVRKRLKDLPPKTLDAAIAATEELMAKCREANPPGVRRHLPVFVPSDDWKKKSTDNLDLFQTLVAQGFIDRVQSKLPGDMVDADYVPRLKREYDALVDAGLTDYFLIVWDMVNFARKSDIMVGPGRGSAGGSLVAYCLGITSIDPIKYGLYFERFWNPGRAKGLPDIDIDFEKSRRPEIKEYLAKKYGEDNVLGIGNHVYFRPLASIRAAAMALSVGLTCTNAICKIIDKLTDAGKVADWDEVDEDEGIQDELSQVAAKYPAEPLDELWTMARMLTNRIKTYSAHASAVVVSDVPLNDYLPARRALNQDKEVVYVTQVEMTSVEDQGFPKFDVLGLQTLDVLRLTIEQAGVPDFDFESHDYDAIPEGIGFWEQIDRGRTLGLFQVEEGNAARRVGKEMKPRSVAELGLITAMNRPGPLRGGSTERMYKRREGLEPVVYPHSVLEDVLEETLGEFIYQEQVIGFMGLIGYSLEDADHIRKVLGKKKVEDMLAEKPTYMALATEHMSKAKAESIWALIEDFSKYAFNKSHSVAYGTILAWTMYAKWQWPAEFIRAGMIVFPERRGSYISEARVLGIRVGPPDINLSGSAATVLNATEVVLGLSNVKGVATAGEWIEKNRPEGGWENLAAFQEWHKGLQEAWSAEPKIGRGKSPNQWCNAGKVEALVNAGAFDTSDPRDILLSDRIELERELFGGVILTDVFTPLLERHRDMIEGLATYEEIEIDQSVKVPGIIREIDAKKVKTGRNVGREMAHLTIEWESEKAKVAVFSRKWAAIKDWIKPDTAAIFTVKGGAQGPIMEGLQILR